MATPSLLDYAALSAIIYNDIRSDKNKLTNSPSGWSQILDDSNAGFSAGAYRNGNDIVIAYKGSDNLQADVNGGLDWSTNLLSFLGAGSPQVVSAALFYEAVKAANPGANITFTGHSLGGGMASLMAVYFDRPATTFDQAPFLATAANPVFTGYVGLALAANGIGDASFSDFAGSLGLLTGFRSSNVQDYFVPGEAVSYIRGAASGIYGSDTPIPVGGGDAISTSAITNAVALHSMTLAAALLIQRKFQNDTIALPSLLASAAPATTTSLAASGRGVVSTGSGAPAIGGNGGFAR